MARRKRILVLGTISVLGAITAVGSFLYSEWKECDSGRGSITVALDTLAGHAERTRRVAEEARARTEAAFATTEELQERATRSAAATAVAKADESLGDLKDSLCMAYRRAVGAAHPTCAVFAQQTAGVSRSIDAIPLEAWQSALETTNLSVERKATESKSRDIRDVVASTPRDCGVDDNSVGDTWRFVASGYKREQVWLDKVLRELALARERLAACSSKHDDALGRSVQAWQKLHDEHEAKLSEAKQAARKERDRRLSFDLDSGEKEKLLKGIQSCESKFGICALVTDLKNDCATIKEGWTQLKR